MRNSSTLRYRYIMSHVNVVSYKDSRCWEVLIVNQLATLYLFPVIGSLVRLTLAREPIMGNLS